MLDAAAYREAIRAIREAVGSELVLQVTSEAGGRYGPDKQRQVIVTLQPEAVSLAVRELFGDEKETWASGELCHDLTAVGSAIHTSSIPPKIYRLLMRCDSVG